MTCASESILYLDMRKGKEGGGQKWGIGIEGGSGVLHAGGVVSGVGAVSRVSVLRTYSGNGVGGACACEWMYISSKWEV